MFIFAHREMEVAHYEAEVAMWKRRCKVAERKAFEGEAEIEELQVQLAIENMRRKHQKPKENKAYKCPVVVPLNRTVAVSLNTSSRLVKDFASQS